MRPQRVDHLLRRRHRRVHVAAAGIVEQLVAQVVPLDGARFGQRDEPARLRVEHHAVRGRRRRLLGRHARRRHVGRPRDLHHLSAVGEQARQRGEAVEAPSAVLLLRIARRRAVEVQRRAHHLLEQQGVLALLAKVEGGAPPAAGSDEGVEGRHEGHRRLIVRRRPLHLGPLAAAWAEEGLRWADAPGRLAQERLVAPLARGERHARVDAAARGEAVEVGHGEAGVKVGVRLDGPRVDGAAARVLQDADEDAQLLVRWQREARCLVEGHATGLQRIELRARVAEGGVGHAG